MSTTTSDMEECTVTADHGNPNHHDWACSAQTDKGVNAMGQVISGRFYIDPPGLVDRLNSNLASQIHIFGFKSDRFSLMPRNSVIEGVWGHESEFVKCLDCSERSHKVVGLFIKRSFESKAASTGLGFVPNTGDDVVHSGVTNLGVSLSKSCNHSNYESQNEVMISIDNGDSEIGDEAVAPARNEGVDLNGGSENCSSIVVGEEKVNGEEKSAKGNGFCYVAIMRNCAPESLIEKALQKDVNINVPTAPEVGLYLEECLFASYNQKWKDTHDELSMKSYEKEAEDFKTNHIYILQSQSTKTGVVALWLHSLNHRNYPDLHLVNNENASNTVGVGVASVPELTVLSERV
ncbi:tRNA pseudouridine synthase [Quillaja saponaria]|uniref:tRNA pseudouridine synthase n=1 Tax=Quillaja saponaria TaxID=32244 RepID=A0AAD7LCI6_QUISA|nr:tRNA pseudouridine synthase [Quillaja saponaria]